ncbi:HTTM domain-containing protein [Streptomyces hesseae]|uniref:HTTM domain-containing protein n=1 Tax=Streptomyces hesseae TaxID=3075519 RepID=A0ABU2SWH5_9ACTN|nr:HTTM domain-containing protein [Streptomyces sp. DSM 40473]MDT0453093.1 HTTM domain-containing protein [Streptomyces sp. DSM 40473]
MTASLSRALARVTGASLGPYQTALLRIGLSFTWLCYLLREWPNRHELYGPNAPWSWGMAHELTGDNHAFTALMWSDSPVWFETVYALAIVFSALLMLGWRTRTMSVLSMLGVLSLQNRSVFIGDGGDNVVHLMALYMVLTRCGQVWSLDARRAARRKREGAEGDENGQGFGAGSWDLTGVVLWVVCGLGLVLAQFLGDDRMSWTGEGPLPGLSWPVALWGLWAVQGLWWAVRRHAPGEPRAVLDALAHLAHNGALLVIMAEVCLIYATAGWYKVQGTRWQDGTALFYPMHIDYFSPWPWLSHTLAASSLVVLLLSYGTVAVQVAFPFTLLNRRVKNVLLALMMAEHLGIAVLLGLPFFSLAMIVADAVFLPTSFLRRLEGARRLLPLPLARWRPEPVGSCPAPRTPAEEADGPADGSAGGPAAVPGPGRRTVG